MDEFEQSDLEKQTDDSHNATYQNAIHYKERENAFVKKIIKPGVHIVVTIAELACDDSSKRILKLSIYPLQISLVKHQYL